MEARRMRQSANVKTLRRLIPAKAASDETGIPYTTLRDRVFRGELPVVKLGTAWYFERKDLNALIEGSKQTFSREAR
jgi:hypothetical protein